MNSNRIEGRVALVTGGSRGIGAAVALRLAEQGADVALTYRQNAEQTRQVARKIEGMGRRALAVPADGADEEALTGAVERTVGTLGRLDVLVNNAALFPSGPLADVDTAELDRVLAVNVRAPFVLARAAAAHLPEGGRIIGIGSNIADRVPFPGLALYAMTKTAMVGLTKGLARELGPRGITVNLVHPGPTDTDANPADGPNAPAISGITALGRYADPAEIAAVVAHLAGPEAGYVTGAVIAADGGFSA
ncbi:SDR family NAD(P)-dependent oxidoreductase [Kitasatospora cineracea]|uniref:3-oxoacyl-[acyl-carrier protein] reductase n=1 Tax=Kitasatospora cineracea TaxID=88074 RepID=A0A8G1UJT2_9ACTN|nr:SDR family oxidoreductase [Kitasatospora cineracea]ROR45165.1 3-oxoacyl-[acyl-carrier protein] reductase [Kitasatospora cineracea]